MKKTNLELQGARAEKWFAKVIGTRFGKMTRSDFYSKYGVGKTRFVETYAKKKINGCYAKLKEPKTYYQIVTLENGECWQYECPKCVFDYMIFVELTIEQVVQYQRGYKDGCAHQEKVDDYWNS